MHTPPSRFRNRGGMSATSLPQRFLDGGLLAVVFLAPLFMGGRGPVGKFVFVSIVAATAMAWSIAQCRRPEGSAWRRSGVEWLLLASVVLVILQLVPFPSWLRSNVSPLTGDMLPLWETTSPVPLPEWSTISLAPLATRGALSVLLAYIMLFLLVVQRIESHEDAVRVLSWVAWGTVAVASLGLTQFLLGNGKFLWVFEHPSRDTFHSVKGPFHNQNHFAHLLALGMGPIILSWLKAPRRSVEKQLFGVGMGLVLLAGLLTFSRGGVLAILIACAVSVIMFTWQSLLDKRALTVVGLTGVFVVAAMAIHGYGPLRSKFAALRESESLGEAVGARADLWSALLEGIPHFAWLGSGIGSHADVYPLFMEEHYNVTFSHGENGYLPLTLEGGLPALVLLLVGIGICCRWSIGVCRIGVWPDRAINEGSCPDHRRRAGPGHPRHMETRLRSGAACMAAIVPGLLASALHSLADFVWYISACMSITVVLAACACRLYQMARDTERNRETEAGRPDHRDRHRLQPARPAWIGVAVIVGVVGTGMIHDRYAAALAAPHWYAYQRLDLSTAAEAPDDDLAERDRLFQLGRHLQAALAKNPRDPRANLHFAGVCLRRFELEQRRATNPMALQQIREAALASQFPNRAAQEAWLEIAVGENFKYLKLALVHTHRALRAAPLQGDGYVYLASLSFLEGPSAAAKTAYIDQAYRVRPHDGAIAFAMGLERGLANDEQGMLRHWETAFRQDPRMRTLIIEHIAFRVSAEEFLTRFEPPIGGLRKLRDGYQQAGRTDDARIVARRLIEQLVQQARQPDGDPEPAIWFELQGLHAFLDDLPQAIQCARQAVALDGNNVTYRNTLGVLLLRHEDFAGATRELEWCLRRKPDDPTLVAQLTAANRGRLQR